MADGLDQQLAATDGQPAANCANQQAPEVSRDAMQHAAAQQSPQQFQGTLAGWMFDMRASVVLATTQARSATAGVDRLETALHSAAQRITGVESGLTSVQEGLWFAERDHRRVLLGGDRVLALFDQQGQTGVRALLVDWARSFLSNVDPAARDWTREAGQALIFATTFPNGGRRLVVDLPSKLVRDELCSAWGRSPARHSQWPDCTVRARLSVQEDSNRKRVLRAFQQPSGEEGGLNGDWLPGRMVQIAADVAVILTAGSPSFRIPLGLPQLKVDALIARALAVVPRGDLQPPIARQELPPPPPVAGSSPAGVEGRVTRASAAAAAKRARLGKLTVQEAAAAGEGTSGAAAMQIEPPA